MPRAAFAAEARRGAAALRSGTRLHAPLRVSNEWSERSKWLVAYSRPPRRRSREPRAVSVCPTRPEGVTPPKARTRVHMDAETLYSHKSLKEMLVVLPPN